MSERRFSREVQEILDRVMSALPELPAWAVPQRQSREGGPTRSEVDQDRQRVLRQLERTTIEADPKLLAEARRRVHHRLDGWQGRGHRVAERRKYHHPIDRRLDEPVLGVDPVERLIMQALAVTSPARQYAVSRVGLGFATSTNGWSRDMERLWLSGLSPLVDDVGQYYADWRLQRDGKKDGRFYERDGSVFAALNNETLLRLCDER